MHLTFVKEIVIIPASDTTGFELIYQQMGAVTQFPLVLKSVS